VSNLQEAKPAEFARFLANPQNWNSYAYTLNNPLNAVDPDGYYTIVIGGTRADPKDWQDSGIVQRVQKTFQDPNTQLFTWSGGNSNAARRNAAAMLAHMINNHKFAPGEKLNIVSHSHGGNVAFLASQKIYRRIDTLVTLGTPMREYRPREGSIGRHINVYSQHDKVQIVGGNSLLAPIETGRAGRTIYGARNIDASHEANSGPLDSHTDLWKSLRVWEKHVVPEIKRPSGHTQKYLP
jgi:hypothetical protein